MIPDDLTYTAEHEWVRELDSGIVRFGITDHAQEALGDIVFVTLPRVGTSVRAGEPCGEVESTKSVSDIYAPVTGEVVRCNESVETAPETLNSDPYGQGWLVEVLVEGEVPSLLSSDEYETLLAAR
ncbi:MAG: glycine cleavage system protein GcvH [Actinobacteria bacterium]|uniref:Unannotated protein n=1 Tax=freshwater metagenome TaxID=449393 RepID=A0A6J7QZJ7_9ZZZZ|nr:glycine cleavage system protein GcvH [Actinomycetota bacterium]